MRCNFRIHSRGLHDIRLPSRTLRVRVRSFVLGLPFHATDPRQSDRCCPCRDHVERRGRLWHIRDSWMERDEFGFG